MISPLKSRYKPNIVSPPGDTLQETLSALGLSQADLAERTGRPKKTINEIVQGKTVITPETALQLERVLGVPASFWVNRESQYRASLARLNEREKLSKHLAWLKQIPVSDMVKLGWIEKFSEPVDQLAAALNFFGVALPELIELNEQIAFRRSQAFNSNPWALSAWLRKGVIEAQQKHCSDYDAQAFSSMLNQVRDLTTCPPEDFVPDLKKRCAQCGVVVVFVPEIRNALVSGATYWLGPSKAVIQLSLRYKTDDHLWFTFFHQSAHILLHGKREVFYEDNKDRSVDIREREADEFASNLLIEPRDLATFCDREGLSAKDIERFADQIGIAPGIVVGRLQHDGLLAHSCLNHLKRKLKWVINK